MDKCPKCASENIEDQGLTYKLNAKNPAKSFRRCKDCGAVFHFEKKEKNESGLT